MEKGHEARKRMVLRGRSSDLFFPVESSSGKGVGWKVEGRDKTGSVGNGRGRDKGEGKILMKQLEGEKEKRTNP